MELRYHIVAILLLTIPAFPAVAQDFVVKFDSTIAYQTIEGWGGHVYPQTWPYHSMDPQYESKLLEELNVSHIRLRSVWYLLEAENDNDDPFDIDFSSLARGDTGLVHGELLIQQRLAERGVTLQFASWRYPYWMAGQTPSWKPQFDDKPPLAHEMEAEYVESLAAYMLYARDRYGIVFDAVSIANEPDLGIYITGLSPSRLLRLSIDLRNRLSKEGYVLGPGGETSVKFYMPDVAAADSIGLSYAREFFEEDGAGDFSSALSYHSYRRDTTVMRHFARLAANAGIPVWTMELSHTHLAAIDRFEWSHALANAVTMYDALVYSNSSLALYWSLAMASSGGLGLYVPEKKAWAPAYQMLKHFYNDIPVGSTRIFAAAEQRDADVSDRAHPWRAASPQDLRVLAFLRPDGSSVVILINTDGTDKEASFPGYRDVKEFVTSDPIWKRHDGTVQNSPPDSTGSGARIVVAARSIVTVVF